MHYPLTLFKYTNGLSFFIPDPEQVRPTYETLRAARSETAFPFWAKIWPSGYELSAFLEQEPQWILGKTVLELGAGIALPSFVIAKHAKEIIASDHAAEAVALMEKNIAYLKLPNVKARLIDWNHFPQNLTADVLLLSDINYATDQFTALLQLIEHFLHAGTTVILSTPQRINITPFAAALQPFIKQTLLRTSKQINEETEIRILILSLS